jgi:sialic acid synthase
MQNKETYIIGEIGQNHNGSVDIAKLIIELVSLPILEEDFQLHIRGMDAVKMTKRDLSEELTDSQMNRPYDSPHSFGKTYGEHRAFLELDDNAHFEVYKHAKKFGLDFVETLCSRGCLSLLKLFTPDYLKVASRDLTNLPLLAAMAETKIPMILSTGMAGKKELDDALNTISAYHSQIAILHCVSEYPTQPVNVNLRTITYLEKNYPQYRIGYSDHTIGISAPVAAVAMGAQIIEKHITLDRRMKGTDQAGSLGPDGVRRMVRDIRVTDLSMGKEEIFICDDTKAAKEKLERSVATLRKIGKGETISEKDLHLLSPGNGFKWVDKAKVIGKKANVDIPANEIILPGMIS